MKIISVIAKLFGGREGAYVIPELSFDSHKVSRNNRALQNGKQEIESAFAAAYLARARVRLESERTEKSLCRRAVKGEIVGAAATDELDKMIEGLNGLKGLNVREREFYARPYKR